jgi:hypothetical protein
MLLLLSALRVRLFASGAFVVWTSPCGGLRKERGEKEISILDLRFLIDLDRRSQTGGNLIH